ncbi:MAG TPA: hypothetical protein VGH76_27520 [Actinomycetospora sp.]|uniref:hypothetical protein n=1 Tax=Actinomycetospora sp. TaxID=1872135 RepID=UPI002F40518D
MRTDLLLALGLYVVAAGWFLWLGAAASAQGVITGEEASITHRDAMSIAMAWQPSMYSTNAASQVFYWLAGHLDPDYGLLYARKWKAAATALITPLIYLAARRRLGCGRFPAVVAGVLVAVLPGVSVVSWVGTEDGLEVVAGAAALYVVTSSRRWWPLGLLAGGLAISLYTAGLSWAVVASVAAVTRVRTARTALAVGLAALGGAAVVLWPLAWWHNGGQLLTGGGGAGADVTAVPSNLVQAARYAVSSGSSYYYFAQMPTLGGRGVAVLMLVGALVAVAARPAARWWAAVAVVATGIYAVSTGVPGARRLIAVAVVAALLAAVALDVLARTPRVPAGARVSAVAVLAFALVAIPVIRTVPWHADLAAGRQVLPVDWPFQVDAGGTQTSTLARLDAEVGSGRLSAAQVGQFHGGTRTMALLFMLDERTGRPPAVLPGDIVGFYRSTRDCRDLDGAAC